MLCSFAKNRFNAVKLLFPLIVFFVLAGCTQTTNGLGGVDAILTAEQQQTKIAAARKRAAADRKKRREDFQKKREERRKLQRGEKTADKKEKKVASKTKKKPKRAKVKIRSIKGTKYAYVGGRSRGIQVNAPWKCVPNRLKIVLRQVSKKFGKVVVNSTHRSRRHNRRVGGRRGSYHLRCQAVDFRVKGRTRGLTRWLANHPYVGGYNRYPSGYYHIDTGPKRTW